MEDSLLSDYRKAVIDYIRYSASGTSAADLAEDVAHEMIVEAMRQPRTQAYLLEQIEQIRRHRLPGKLRQHASHLSRILGATAGFRLGVDEIGHVPDRDCELDHRRQEIRILISDLAQRDPCIRRLRDAYVSGCETLREAADYLGVSERTLYERLCNVRRRWASQCLAS